MRWLLLRTLLIRMRRECRWFGWMVLPSWALNEKRPPRPDTVGAFSCSFTCAACRVEQEYRQNKTNPNSAFIHVISRLARLPRLMYTPYCSNVIDNRNRPLLGGVCNPGVGEIVGEN